ncbi:MAG: HlyD family efflux transporter periplasmic adaptor subunit [Candidatus Buchananbacteria bacterium]
MKKIIKSKIFWVILVIVIIIIGFVVKTIAQPKKIKYDTQPVKRGDVIQTVTATGQVKSASEVELNFKNIGKISTLKAKVGDTVKAGDILATQKATDLEISIAKYRNELAKAKANLDKIISGATKEDIAVYQAAVDKYQGDLASAKTDLENTKATYKQTWENEKQNIIVDMSGALSKANVSLQKVYDTLYYKGDPNSLSTSNYSLKSQVRNEYDEARGKVIAAQSVYDTASMTPDDEKINLAADSVLSSIIKVAQTVNDLGSLLDYAIVTSNMSQTELDALKVTINAERATAEANIGTLQGAKHDLETARLNYQTKVSDAQDAIFSAEKNLAKAQADLAYKEAPARTEDIVLYQAAYRNAEADLRLALDNYENTLLKAPIDGVITEVNYEVGEQTGLTQNAAGSPAIRMLAAQNYEIEVNIPESDITKINLADVVDITLDAFSDSDLFKGNVTTINPAQTKIQDVVYYRVTVIFSLDQPENVRSLVEKIKPGMTANVTVSTAKATDVLIIPLRAVKEKDDKSYVQILENEQPKSIDVILGLKGDEGMVEVKSGLVEGQSVITYTANK